MGLVYNFRGFVHYNHGETWWCAGTKGDGEEAKIPTTYLQAAEEKTVIPAKLELI